MSTDTTDDSIGIRTHILNAVREADGDPTPDALVADAADRADAPERHVREQVAALEREGLCYVVHRDGDGGAEGVKLP